MPKRKLTPQPRTIPFQGGAITSTEPALLPFGSYSAAQNVRPKHPGFVKRAGMAVQHTLTTETSNQKVLSMYQFRKSEVDEKHFYAQFSDGDVLEATTAPPGVTTGEFGTEKYSGTGTGEYPASWAEINDLMVYSNGVDPHQIYGGTTSFVKRAVSYTGTSAQPDIPQEGQDFSDEVQNTDDTKLVTLTGMAAGDDADMCLCVMTPVPAKSFHIYFKTANTELSSLSMTIGEDDNTWHAATITADGTDNVAETVTFSKDGVVTFTKPVTEQPRYMYGAVGYWYRFHFDGDLTSPTTINYITYDCDWSAVINMWDGVLTSPVEVWVENNTNTQYDNYAASSVDLDTLTAGWKTILFCTDPIEAVYVDVGDSPSDAANTPTWKYWDGDSFETVGTVTDESSGLRNSGWMTFPRKTAYPVQFESSQYYAYVYELTWSSNLGADTEVGFMVRPYFDIAELGNGQTACAWKDRIAYSFDRYPQYLYVTALGLSQVLNGGDFGIIEVGDGRSNRIVAQRMFHNELVVWQEEKGVEGGCITLIEGFSPITFGKLILSSRIGAMNNKCVDIVDGVTVGTTTDEQIKTMAFFLSRRGVYACDGRVVYRIDADIRNYFDPRESECITRGTEKEMWLKYDSSCHCLRLGLVSGTGGTVPNIFPVFDLQDKVWYFDVLAQELSCMEEIEAGSGDTILTQVGGGTDDGTVYVLNTGTNDVTTAIDSHITAELDGKGEHIVLTELLVRAKAQTAGNIEVTISANNIAKVTDKELSMIAEVATQTIRRHKFNTNVTDQHISIKFKHDTETQSMHLLDFGIKSHIWEGR